MMLAGGMLGWSEGQFWAATPAYFRASLQGLARFHGQEDDAPMTEDAYEALKAKVAEQDARRAQKSV